MTSMLAFEDMLVEIPASEPRELAQRSSGPIEVTLYWWEAADAAVLIELIDRGGGASFQLVVPPDRALDAFHHPYAYASSSDAPTWLRHADVWAPDGRPHAIRVD
ncbi:MAG: hypothetical protein ACJ76I_16475 [Gaiellaceae bacterium]